MFACCAQLDARCATRVACRVGVVACFFFFFFSYYSYCFLCCLVVVDGSGASSLTVVCLFLFWKKNVRCSLCVVCCSLLVIDVNWLAVVWYLLFTT